MYFNHLCDVTMQPTDLEAVIDRSLRLLQPRLQAAAAGQIQVVCNYGKLSAVECSPEIGQVFTSLIAQAIDALADGGQNRQPQIKSQITIRTLQIPDPQGGNPRAIVCVADNGAEILLAMQSEIFSPSASGVRASSALSACYEVVVNQHGGDLQCYSQAGRTEFWVELPVRQILKQAISSSALEDDRHLLYV